MTFVNAHEAKTQHPLRSPLSIIVPLHTATHHDYYFHHHYALCQCQRDLLSVCLRLSTAAIASFLSKHLPAISLLLPALWSVYYFWQYVLAQKMSTTCACQACGFIAHVSCLSLAILHCQSASQSVSGYFRLFPFPFPELIEAHNTN